MARTRGAQSLNVVVGGAPVNIDGVVVPDKEPTMNKKSIFLSQIIMTFIMAATMSGIMGLIFTGPSMEWLTGWPRQFIIAWPASMALTGAILRPREAKHAPEGA
ncbi:DUF2798 domain-containing protein [Arthrobacter pigmenti]